MRQLKISKSITNRESQSVEKYLQEIGRVELITAEEEVELAKRIKKGDQIALEKLVNANLRFVLRCIFTYITADCTIIRFLKRTLCYRLTYSFLTKRI